MTSSIQSKIKAGSAFGAVLLITGSCVGAGMLALPVITGLGGFLPSCLLFVLAWLFMTISALLLLEANLTLGYHLSLISIAEKTLGKTGKLLCWLLFAFLFYSLGIAYIAASGTIVQSIGKAFLGITISSYLGCTFFTLVFGVIIYLGTRMVDHLNRVLMVGLVAAYFLMVGLGSYYIKGQYLLHADWKYAFAALPVLVISFGFHNMIPTLAGYLKGDVKRLKVTVLIGSLLPLIIYLMWEAVMLGIIPIEGRSGLLMALDKGEAATSALQAILGSSAVSIAAESFALFAIITSFLAQSLSLVDFLSDGLKISKEKKGRVFLIALTLAPPFLFAFFYPGIFIEALNMAGGFSAVLLFGAMPALMVWVLRYKRKTQESIRLVPGGKVLLILILLSSLAIFALELAQELGFSLIPKHVESIP